MSVSETVYMAFNPLSGPDLSSANFVNEETAKLLHVDEELSNIFYDADSPEEQWKIAEADGWVIKKYSLVEIADGN